MAKVRIRMYRQGLGDSFLLTFPGGGKPEHVLIDSGVLLGTADAEAKMRAVAENVLTETGGKLDVLIATHEHWDHLSGFVQAQEVWEKFEIGEVWLAWTEDLSDDLAQELRQKKQHAIAAVAGAARHLAASGDANAAAMSERLESVLGFFGPLGAAGSGSTEDALAWVKERKAKIRFLRPGELLSELGVRVFVLGPPHDRKLIKRSDPSTAHPEVYHLAADETDRGLLAAVGALEGGEPGRQPFAPWYQLSAAEARAEPLFSDCYDRRGLEWRTIKSDWLSSAGPLALKLDSDTNNTSLALAFELSDGGDVLLFPGDAQVGNWLSWEAVEFDDAPEVTSADLLGRTVLYKVGHHASHNATLQEKGLELMVSAELAAMIPVNREMAKKKKWNMPFPPLFDRLKQKTMGRILDAEEGLVVTKKPAALTAKQWQSFRKRAVVKDGWIDYTVDF
jgi:metallo-beta-lactamase superfamily protein